MDRQHRDLIKKNIVKLVQRTDYQKLVQACVQHEIITQVMKNNIEEAEQVISRRHEALFMKITQRGPTAFSKLESVLLENGWTSAASLLNVEQPYDDTMASINRARSHRKPLVTSTNLDGRPQIRPSEPGRSELKEYDGIIIDMWQIEKMIKMKRPDHIPKCNGILLLVNYKVGRPDADREKDYIIDLFHKLNFKVFYSENESLKVIQKHIEDLKLKHFGKDDPACFVYCHLGVGTSNATLFNDEKVLIHEHIKRFNNINCPSLSNKMKLFIFPSCNSKIMSTLCKNEMDYNSSHETYRNPSNGDVRLDRPLPSFSDISFFFLEHDESSNSFLKSINAFCEIISKYAHSEPLPSLLKLFHNHSTSADHSVFRETSDYGIREPFNFLMLDDR